MGYTSPATWKTTTVPFVSISPRYQQSDHKQLIGRTIVPSAVLGKTALDVVLQVRFKYQGTLAANDQSRTDLETLNDGEYGTWTDGVHSGTFIMLPDSLQFEENGRRSTVLEGSFTLVQYQQ